MRPNDDEQEYIRAVKAHQKARSFARDARERCKRNRSMMSDDDAHFACEQAHKVLLDATYELSRASEAHHERMAANHARKWHND